MPGPQVDSGGAIRAKDRSANHIRRIEIEVRKKTFRRQFSELHPDGESYIGHPLYLGAKMTADEVL
ncbi:MAG: hypothetical protein WCF47_06600 [Pseudolabrys sp.]